MRRNVIALGLVSLFTDMASNMVTPILPLFVVLVLDEGVDKVGIIGAVTTFVSYILRIAGGYLSDRYDRNKPFLLVGYGISAVSKPLFALAGGWVGITAIRSVERLGKAARAAPKDKLISQSAVKNNVGRTFGLHKTLDVTGEFSGLIVVMILLTIWGSTEASFRTIFQLSLIPGLIAIGVLLFGVREIGGGKAKKRGFGLSIDPELRRPIGAFAAFSFFMFGEAFFVLRGNEQGLPLNMILLLLIGLKAVQMALSYRVGVAIDQYSEKALLTAGYALGLLALGLLLIPNLWGLTAAFLIYGAHGIFVLNAVRTLIGNRAADKGSAFGFLYLIQAISVAFGTLFVGYLWELQSSTLAIAVGAVGIIISIALHLLLAD
ncbi:MAG: MFS transporter [Chloroflexota bacterium]